jgi:hypothetical protein
MRRYGWLVAAVGVLVLSASGGAQDSPLRDIVGRVVGPDGAGIPSVLVRAQRGEDVRETLTDSTGRYRIVGAWAGTWAVTMRRIGYVADSATVEVSDVGRLDRQLARAAVRVDGRVITASWSGVHGVVGDRGYQPVAGATVEVVGRDLSSPVTPEGQFALPQQAGASVLLRVRAPGYESRLVSARVPADGRIELSVLLDQPNGGGINSVIADELDRRMTWSSPFAARVTRTEVLAAETRDLRLALELSPSVNAKGLRVSRAACVFVDGVARPGFPLDAIAPETVEFIELYSGDADRQGLLARRWPPRGECGFGGRGPTGAQNTAGVQYVVVWTHRA